MSRVIITNELSDTIRDFRIRNNIQSTDLSLQLNKSPAFVSRIEKGKVKTIDSETLYKLLKCLIREESDTQIAEDIYRSLTIRYSSEEIKKQLWFTNFDTVKCYIPIPSSLIDDINDKISLMDISREYLLYRINTNEAIPDDEINDTSIPNNIWYISNKDGRINIKVLIKSEILNAILDKVKISMPYIYIMAISYYLFKIEKYGEKTEITNDEYFELMEKVTEYLNSFKFYSVSEKNKLLASSKSQEEYRQILNSFDVENYELVNRILSLIRYASDRNITDTNDKLKLLYKNMSWDLGFMLKALSLDYYKLDSLSFTEKKSLIGEINDLISSYLKESEHKPPIEYY